jgi:asparagine synthase (glutamine-hydrolysing)
MQVINASQFQNISKNQYSIYSEKSEDFLNTLVPNPELLSSWVENYQPFAFVLVHNQSGDVFLIRDHLGVRPLYYYYACEKLIFGNNIPDILSHLPSLPKLFQPEIENSFSYIPIYTDNTLYENIHRVEPGHRICITVKGCISKQAYWQLDSEGEELQYSNDKDYLDHFSELLAESMRTSLGMKNKVAAEFSAGLDSSAIYCSAIEIGVKPELFMHAALPKTDPAQRYKDNYEKAFIDHFQITNLHKLYIEDFDPIAVFKEYASWFAGAPPYSFYMFANNIHKAVVKAGHSILLSGFGGDQGVSHPVPTRFILPSLIKQKQYKQAWKELGTNDPFSTKRFLSKLFNFTKYSHPVLYDCVEWLQDRRKKSTNLKHPYRDTYVKNLRQAEWNFLQGPFSHEIRMRIEYSSIVSKKMGFEYRYPLLHPKLLSFFLSIPYTQKRKNNEGRALIKAYLERRLSSKIFEAYKKREGLDILASTYTLFKEKYEQGAFQKEFGNLPYPQYVKKKCPHLTMIKEIEAFMLKHYLENKFKL